MPKIQSRRAKWRVVAFLALFLAVLPAVEACRSSRPASPTPPEQLAVTISPELAGKVQVDFIEMETEGFLEVEVLVRNVSTAKVECVLGFQFSDAAGRPVPAAGGFAGRCLSLEPGAATVFSEKSADKAARKFRISAVSDLRK
jgi:hypothetical protein